MPFESGYVYLAAASLCAIVAAFFDIQTRRIPNWLTGSALILGLAIHGMFDGWHGLLTSSCAALICGGIFLVFYMAGGMGAGDVKLMAATACLAGLPHASYLMVLTSLAGGVMALVLVLMRGALRQTFFNMVSLVSHHASKGLAEHPELNVRNSKALRLPYGLAIAAGCMLTFYLQGAQR